MNEYDHKRDAPEPARRLSWLAIVAFPRLVISDVGRQAVRHFAPAPAFLLVGCGSKHVRILVEQGVAVPDARVGGIRLSVTAAPVIADANGVARLGPDVQGTRWIKVDAAGYRSVRVDASRAYPADFELTREK